MEPTRERIISAAMKLFAEKGYLATSVADILKEAGAHSGSLYHFFPTKQDVLTAALEVYRDGIGPMLLKPAWAGIADPIERVFALLAAYQYRGAVRPRAQWRTRFPEGGIVSDSHHDPKPIRCLSRLRAKSLVQRTSSSV